MTFECITEKFLNAVSSISHIATKHLTLPSLQGLLLSVKNSILTIRATNLEIGVEISLPVKDGSEGEVVVPANLLRSFLNSVSSFDTTVKCSLSGEVLQVNTEHTSATLQTFSNQDFPTLPRVAKEKSFLIPKNTLLEGFKSVIHSTSHSTMKPELSSVYVYEEGGHLFFVATDSFRLSEKKIPVKMDGFESLLVPQKNVIEIIKVLESQSDISDIELFSTTSQFTLQAENLYITSRVVEGTFPDYRAIIPTESETEVIALKKDFEQALKIGSLFSDKFSKVTLITDPKNKTLLIDTKGGGVGENVTKVESSVEGEKLSMNFNSRYINDGLSSVSADSVNLLFSDGKPLVIKGVGDGSFLYLVMAMNK